MGSKRPGNPGQKRASKQKARARRHQPRQAATTRRIVDRALVDEFLVWVQADGSAPDHDTVATLLDRVLSSLAENRLDFEATAWIADDAHAILDTADALADDDPDMAAPLVATALAFLDFLSEASRWTGAVADLEHCIEDFNEYLEYDPDTVDFEDIDLPEVDAEDELAALLALPLISIIIRMVDTPEIPVDVGDGTDLAAALGVEPELALQYWTVADAIDFFDAEHFDEGTVLLRHPTVDSVPLMAALLTAHVRMQFAPPEVPDVNTAISRAMLLQVVLAGMTAEPRTNTLDEKFDGYDDEVVEIATRSNAQLRQFVDQGWLTAGEVHEVPVPLQAAVFRGLEEAFDRPVYEDE